MVQHKGTYLPSLARHKRIYLGADGQQQQIKLRSGTKEGVYFYNASSQIREDLGAAHYMALAPTECCAEYGHGKVFFYQTPDNWQTRSTGLRGLPREMWYTPNLLYVDFEWNEDLRNEWFSRKHDQRLDLLNARAGALDSAIPVMPIVLCWERAAYETVVVWEGKGSVMLSYNDAGHMHVGFVDEITAAPGTQHIAALPGNHCRPHREYWVMVETNIANYRMRDGPHAVQTLHQMYQQLRNGTIVLYRSIQEDAIKAHKIWVAQGGYTIRGDKLLGPKVQDKVDIAEGKEPERATPALAADSPQASGPFAPNPRLAELYARTAEWPEDLQALLQEFCAVVLENNIIAMARFLSGNEDWLALDQGQQQVIIDIGELEAEEFDHRQLP